MESKAETLALTIKYASAIFVLLAGFIVYVVVISRIKYNRYYSEKKKMEEEYQRNLLQSKIEIQEQTFKFIAQELHDNVAQNLTLAKMTLNGLINPENEAIHHQLLDTKELVGNSIREIRELSQNLTPNRVLENGLPYSVNKQLEIISNSGGPKFELEVVGIEKEIKPGYDLILFRIVQELVNNIVKHANANLITCKIHYTPLGLVITVKDDGIGFDTGVLLTKDGLGLLNMSSRAKSIGAVLETSSVPGKGTVGKITLSDLNHEPA